VIIHVAAGLIDEGYSTKKPGTVLKKLCEVATPVYFAASTDARLAAWAGKHFAHLGVTVSPADCAFLIAYSGKSMYLLANEIEKVAYYVLEGGRTEATAEDIRRVAVPVAQVDAFSLSNAILAGRTADALDALAVLKFERTEPTIVMGEISKTFCDMQIVRTFLDAGRNAKEIASILKMHEYKVSIYFRAAEKRSPEALSRLLDLCRNADVASKSGGATGYDAVESLVATMLGRG
jgi:DNA polymerase-3 subunit delta